MSLADALIADLEHQDGEDLNESLRYVTSPPCKSDNFKTFGKETVVSVHEIAQLRNSDKLCDILAQIKYFSINLRNPEDIVGPVEYDQEYQVIVESNNMCMEIDNEIKIIHRFVRDKYANRFPELESLIADPIEYILTVKELGNDLDKAKNNCTLQRILPQASIMVVSVTASTTQGQMMNENEKSAMDEACDLALDLSNIEHNIFNYVESRMALIAPNMSSLVGASTAAKMMGVAGGITQLSKMPACNFLVLGCQKKLLSGFSEAMVLPHTGYIYYSKIVQESPPDIRRKMARLVAAKCSLAARVDACHENRDGIIGLKLREEIEKKLDKLTAPPPIKSIKPLSKPIDIGRKRRGGRRVRKMKERYAMTEYRKQSNRIHFADIEDDDLYQEDLGYFRGMIGKMGSRNIRVPVIDVKTKVRISKTLQKNLQNQQQVWGGSTTVRRHVLGTSSSVAFTTLQGLEIVNPQAAEKCINKQKGRYFSNVNSF